MGVAVQHLAHRLDRLLPLALVLDPREFALQAGDEFGVAVLPVAAQRLGQVGAPGLDPPRRGGGRQDIAFADFRGNDGAAQFARLGKLSQGFQRTLLAVDQEQAARDRRAGTDPVEQFALVGMGGIAVDPADRGADHHILARNAHPPRPLQNDPAQRSCRLIADEQHRRLALVQVVDQVVADAARLAHPRRRHDDRTGHGIEPDRFLHALDEVKPRLLEGLLAREILQLRRVLFEHPGRLAGQRAVDEHRHVGDRARVHQLRDVQQQFLRAFQRKCGDHQIAAPRQGSADFRFQHLAPPGNRHRFARAVAISAFAEHVVEPGGAFGVGVERLVVWPQIARTQHPHAARFQFDRGRTQDMPRIPQPRPDAGSRFEPLLQLHRAGLPPGGDSVSLGIERVERVFARPVAAAVAPRGVGLLDAARVGQHVFQQVSGRLGAPDPPGEAFRHQPRQQAGMVDVGMGQDHRVDLGRIEPERAGVQPLQRARALEQPAVDQNAPVPQREFVAGTGHGARGPVQRQGQVLGHARRLLLLAAGSKPASGQAARRPDTALAPRSCADSPSNTASMIRASLSVVSLGMISSMAAMLT